MTSLPFSGGCQCGAVRYDVTGAPVTLYLCHCTDCQKQSGAAFGMSLKVKVEDFHITQGTPKTWTRQADSGGSLDCVFCPDCGTRLYHAPSRSPSMVSVKPGTLDDTSALNPVGHLWTKSKQAWVPVPDEAVIYQTQPPNFDALIEAWQKKRVHND